VQQEKAWWNKRRIHSELFAAELEAALRLLALLPATGSIYTKVSIAQTTLACGLAAGMLWAALGRDLPVEFQGLFVGTNGLPQSAAKSLDGSRSGNRTNRPRIQTRSGRRLVGRAE